jgi:hypothetical protein
MIHIDHLLTTMTPGFTILEPTLLQLHPSIKLRDNVPPSLASIVERERFVAQALRVLPKENVTIA